jgi:hypothetical protein
MSDPPFTLCLPVQSRSYRRLADQPVDPPVDQPVFEPVFEPVGPAVSGLVR